MSLTISAPTESIHTAAALHDLPGDARFELIEGKLIAMAPTGNAHGAYTSDLTVEIGWYVRQNNLGRCYAAETGFLIARDPDTVLAPDFAFIAASRLTFGLMATYVPIVPDLVLETRSPSDSGPDVAAKIKRWISAGTRMVLDLSPANKTITVHRPGNPIEILHASDTLSGYDVLPNFALPLSRLF